MTAKIAITNCDNWDQDIILWAKNDLEESGWNHVSIKRGDTLYMSLDELKGPIVFSHGAEGPRYGSYQGSLKVVSTLEGYAVPEGILT